MFTLSQSVKALITVAVMAILAAAVTGCTFRADLVLDVEVRPPPSTQPSGAPS